MSFDRFKNRCFKIVVQNRALGDKQANRGTGLRGRAVYAYFLKKNVDGQGTQAIIKNLNLKKSKRFWNQNFIEMNDYTV